MKIGTYGDEDAVLEGGEIMADEKFIYFIGTYEEHGTAAERATFSRDKSREIVRELTTDFHGKGVEELQRLELLFGKTDEEIEGCHELSSGWGGALFYVTRIE